MSASRPTVLPSRAIVLRTCARAAVAALAGLPTHIIPLAVYKQPTSGTPEELRAYENISAAAIMAAALKLIKKQ